MVIHRTQIKIAHPYRFEHRSEDLALTVPHIAVFVCKIKLVKALIAFRHGPASGMAHASRYIHTNK